MQNARYEVLCSIADMEEIIAIEPRTDAYCAIENEGKPAGSAGSTDRQRRQHR
jgi:hypothetical protein